MQKDLRLMYLFPVDIGYRGFDVDPDYESYFEDLNQDKFSKTFHFGLNLGNVFSFH